MITLVLRAYSYFAERKWILMLLVGSMVLCCTILLSNIKLEERITYLLPDDRSSLSTDLELLQSTPLQKKLLITLHAANKELAGKKLADATHEVAQKLKSPLFTATSYNIENVSPKALIVLRNMVPALFDAELEQQIAKQVTTNRIASALAEHKRTLSTIDGLVQAQVVMADPLNLYVNTFSKLQALRYLNNIRVLHGIFMTPDEEHSLIVAETAISSTDSAGSLALEEELDRIEKLLPEGVTWSVLGAQRYTAANASTIKKDITTTSLIAAVALLLIVLCFLRTKQVFFIMLIPALAYTGGAAAVAANWSPASAMTFGFGPVLAGMAIDFGLHLYYVIGTPNTSKAESLKQAVQPILISGGTTIAAFSILMLSPVPGLRQLSLFIVVGLLTALFLTLFVFPHILSGSKAEKHPLSFRPKNKSVILSQYIAILLIACFGASNATVQRHIRDLGIKPEKLLAIEKETQSIWGSRNGQALLFANGATFDEAITNTALGFKEVSPEDTQNSIALALLLPPQKKQQTNISRWIQFVQDHNSTQATIQKEAAKLGYSSSAFTPFYSFLAAVPKPITVSMLRQLGFGSNIDTLIIKKDSTSDGVTLISYLPDNQSVNNAFTPELEEKLNLRLVSQSRLGEELSKVLTGTFATYIGYALCIILVLIVAVHKTGKQCLCALLPACFGLLVMMGVFGLLNKPLSIFSLAGALLVLGHGVDYGVYATHAIKNNSQSVPHAILISGLTSLAGFGALLFANHPALFDMGLSVFSGLLAAMPCALLLLPTMFSKETLS